MGSPESFEERTKVLYIGGYSRSGTTLLLRLLGELPGMVAVGELFDVWNRSYTQNQLCGCGDAFQDCEFWRAVTIKAFGCEPADLPADRYQRLGQRVRGTRSVVPLWLPPLRSGSYVSSLRAYARTLQALYGAIANVSGARFIVDSSKEPHQAWVLREAPGIELHVVHMVRDGRAVAFSWRRTKVRPEIHWRAERMTRQTILRSSLEWDIHNFLVSTRRSSLASYTLIRYEDLVRIRRPSSRRSAGRSARPGTTMASSRMRRRRSGYPIRRPGTPPGSPPDERRYGETTNGSTR